MAKVILDAGHGGQEPGAMYEGRKEKDDTLRLALAVGQILEDNGVDVAFTRTEDVYDTPFEKAQIANREGGDFLISFHRNSSPQANQYSGVESLIFNRSGEKVAMAENINRQLEQVGFRDLGVRERPGLVILRRSRMPAVLVETGFLNTDADNELFDTRFDEIAQAIADGILETLGKTPVPARNAEEGMSSMPGTGDRMQSMMDTGSAGGRMQSMMDTGNAGRMMQNISGRRSIDSRGGWESGEGDAETVLVDMQQDNNMEERGMRPCPPCRSLYRVQTGAFRNRKYAEDMLYQLLSQNFPAYILREDNFFKVQVGAFRQLDNAVRMEQTLRRMGYSTYITT